MCACFVFFHMYHYIIQVSSNPIPAFKVVIRQLRTQQTSVTYLAKVLAKFEMSIQKPKTGKCEIGLSCQDGISPHAPLLCDRSGNREPLLAQLGNPASLVLTMYISSSYSRKIVMADCCFSLRAVSMLIGQRLSQMGLTFSL